MCKKRHLFLVGDSICQKYEKPWWPQEGWGAFLQEYFSDSIIIENRARAGWSTKSFFETEDEMYSWNSIKRDIRKNDFVLISIGINDAGKLCGTTEVEFKNNLGTMIEDVLKIGATPILSTTTISGEDYDKITDFQCPGNSNWETRGKMIVDTAEEWQISCLPLDTELMARYKKMKDEYILEKKCSEQDACNFVRCYFHLYTKNLVESKENGGWGLSIKDETLPKKFYEIDEKDDIKYKDDSTHLNVNGAKYIAGLVAKLVLNSDSRLAEFINVERILLWAGR